MWTHLLRQKATDVQSTLGRALTSQHVHHSHQTSKPVAQLGTTQPTTHCPSVLQAQPSVHRFWHTTAWLSASRDEIRLCLNAALTHQERAALSIRHSPPLLLLPILHTGKQRAPYLTVLSLDPVARVLDPREKATQNTMSLWPLSVLVQRWLSRSQSLADRNGAQESGCEQGTE